MMFRRLGGSGTFLASSGLTLSQLLLGDEPGTHPSQSDTQKVPHRPWYVVRLTSA